MRLSSVSSTAIFCLLKWRNLINGLKAAEMTSNLSFYHFLCFLFKTKWWDGYLSNLSLMIKFLHFNRQKMTVELTALNHMQLNENKSKIFESEVVFSVFNSLQDGVLRFSQKCLSVAVEQRKFRENVDFLTQNLKARHWLPWQTIFLKF